MSRNLFFLLIISISFFSSCREKKLPKGFEEGDQYFSITEYLNDQWKNKGHLPITMQQITQYGDKTDTNVVKWDSTFFKNMRTHFDKADISHKKFLGEYKFTPIEDEENGAVNLFFEATNDDLYTQKMIIAMDPIDQMVKSIYIETLDDGVFAHQSQKLTYNPNNYIQIISYDKKILSDPKELFITYKMNY